MPELIKSYSATHEGEPVVVDFNERGFWVMKKGNLLLVSVWHPNFVLTDVEPRRQTPCLTKSKSLNTRA